MHIIVGIFVLAMVLGPKDASSAELLMFESPACDWCEAWDHEVGIVYPKTSESRIAPLRRLDVDAPLEGKLSGLRPVMFTPTFVLMDEGKEVGRILGYPGESNFWGLLDQLITELPPAVNGCLPEHRKLAKASGEMEIIKC